MLLLNVLTVGGVQLVVFLTQRDWQRRQDQAVAQMQQWTYESMFVTFLRDIYTPERLKGGAPTRELIQSPLIERSPSATFPR